MPVLRKNAKSIFYLISAPTLGLVFNLQNQEISIRTKPPGLSLKLIIEVAERYSKTCKKPLKLDNLYLL